MFSDVWFGQPTMA